MQPSVSVPRQTSCGHPVVLRVVLESAVETREVRTVGAHLAETLVFLLCIHAFPFPDYRPLV